MRGMNQKHKILIVEDDLDVQEVLELLVQSNYDCEITVAGDGLQALTMLGEGKNFDLITSDMNMPRMKGDKLYTEIRKFDQQTPFILVSSERLDRFEAFRSAIQLYHLDKPFADEDLKLVFDKALASKQKNTPPEYVPIRLSVLVKIQEIQVPLYIKISDQKYVKILNEDAQFNSEELKRFERKQTDTLYIKKENFYNFINKHQKLVFSKEAWPQLNEVEATKELSIDLDLISKASHIFGWSQEIINLANENIGRVIQLAEKTPKFQKVVEIFKTEKNIRLATHSIVLTYLMTDVAKRLSWGSEITLRKLAFAAVLHDMDLDEDLFVAKQTLLQEGNLKNFPETPELKRIIDHPTRAANLVLNWPLCPPDVDIIIRQHHEKPDGGGFPAGLKNAKISPLSALFIMAEDIIYHCIENFGEVPKDYLLSKKGLYSSDPFKEIFKAMVGAL